MKIGVNTASLDSAVGDAVEAERLGFDYLGCGEHLFFHGPTPNGFIALAAAAGATDRIGLVSAISLLPLYPAALLAKLAASLDRVSQGRFELGVGAGGEFPAEFEAAGVDPATRFRRLDEGLRLLAALFTGEKVTFDGEFTSVRDLALQPPPLRPGGPPIWMGGRKRGAIRRAGRFADVWMPYMVDPDMLAASLGQVRAAAADAGRPPAAVDGAIFAWTCVDADASWAKRTGIDAVSAAYAQDFTPLADRYLVLGDPADVAARLRAFAEAGASRVLIQVAAPPEERGRVIDTFAREVLPRLRTTPAADTGGVGRTAVPDDSPNLGARTGPVAPQPGGDLPP